MLRRGIAATVVVVSQLTGCDGSTDVAAGTASSATPPAPAAATASAGMPLAIIGIRQKEGSDYDYRVDHDALLQAMVLAVSGALPASPLASGPGYRIDAAPEGSVLALAGLLPGDEVTAINGMPLSGPESLQRAYTLLRATKTVVVTVTRDGHPLALSYEVSRTPLSRSDRLPARPRRPSSRPRLTLETLKDDIQEVSKHTYLVSATLVEELTSDQLMRSARVVPKLEDGKVAGMKLYAIRRSSLLGALGFKNGDTVTTINGRPVASPDAVLELYSKLTPTPGAEATVVILRRGKPITLRYRVGQGSSPPPSARPQPPAPPRIEPQLTW